MASAGSSEVPGSSCDSGDPGAGVHVSGSLRHGLSVPFKTTGLANKEVRLEEPLASSHTSPYVGISTLELLPQRLCEQQRFIPHGPGWKSEGRPQHGCSLVRVSAARL